MAAAFALSYGSLDPAEQRMFRLLGPFPGTETGLPAAAALAALPETAADRLLEGLVDGQLLDEPRPGRLPAARSARGVRDLRVRTHREPRRPAGRTGQTARPRRYRLHDLLGVYAACECGRTESPADRRAAPGRLLDFYPAAVDDAEERLHPQRRDRADAVPPGAGPGVAGRPEAPAWLDVERGNFVPLIRAAADAGRHAHAWQSARCLWGFFETRGHWTEWIVCLELALPSARLLGDRLAEVRLRLAGR